MGDYGEQRDEIFALQSILDESQIRNIQTTEIYTTGCILIKPSVNGDWITITASNGDRKHTFTVKDLCPLELHFDCPVDYPSKSPPNFRLVCKWLDQEQLSKLQKLMLKTWKQGQAVLYDWIQLLQHELFSVLNVVDNTLDLSWSYPSTDTDRDSQFYLLALFKTSYLACPICIEEKTGSEMIEFPLCNHIFCKECVKSHFTERISCNFVNDIFCPDGDKCESLASPGLVRELVSAQVFERYDEQLLESMIAAMPNLIRCPREKCQYPVCFETDSTIATCPMCRFSFCLHCKATSHGIGPCKLPSKEKLMLLESYENGSHAEREALEKLYGKEQLINGLRNRNELMSDHWMSENSKPCPRCHIPIEKNSGCNKMYCGKCSMEFCWMCLAKLNHLEDPYLHFRDKNSKCFLALYA